VDSVREIIDGVKPKRTFYTLEPMPWMYPDSPEIYLKMLKDIDRPAFGVHLDYANMINGLDRFRNASDFIRQCFEMLGPHIKSVHAKDVALMPGALPCYLQEKPPGEGSIDFGLVLRLTQGLGDDTTLFVEHISSHEGYMAAARQI
jgi:sugar phosphate isomerase/epimerase